ncbi:MAG TPA: response regulator, partial [Bryobacteraceae bacterium]|nr:response regulator [Bryobacteraceae bacterium]
PGHGTTFCVLLPVAGSAPAGLVKDPAAVIARGMGTILVVDDEEMVRTAARRALEYHGYNVLTADDGRQAIETVAAHDEILAVILDLAMPAMTGDQAAPRLRQIRPRLPIILSSGYPEHEATRRFVRHGVTAFLEKPYTARNLAEKIASVLG